MRNIRIAIIFACLNVLFTPAQAIIRTLSEERIEQVKSTLIAETAVVAQARKAIAVLSVGGIGGYIAYNLWWKDRAEEIAGQNNLPAVQRNFLRDNFHLFVRFVNQQNQNQPDPDPIPQAQGTWTQSAKHFVIACARGTKQTLIGLATSVKQEAKHLAYLMLISSLAQSGLNGVQSIFPKLSGLRDIWVDRTLGWFINQRTYFNKALEDVVTSAQDYLKSQPNSGQLIKEKLEHATSCAVGQLEKVLGFMNYVEEQVPNNFEYADCKHRLKDSIKLIYHYTQELIEIVNQSLQSQEQMAKLLIIKNVIDSLQEEVLIFSTIEGQLFNDKMAS